MNIAPIFNTTFSATIKREVIYYPNKKKYIKNPSLEDVLERYDDILYNVKIQKQKAAEVDTFMNSDEVKTLLDELPQEDSIVINQNCEHFTSNRFPMAYSTTNTERARKLAKFPEFCYCFAYNNEDDGPLMLDKEKIIFWLKTLLTKVK